ncbi:hypothetical protein [Alteromonas lipolytica]|uniref:Uncharacterized protein n=1 Tax=Alteromonas lipolytica TaxID=1856405 RepID=A0A1E8FFM1_9ALTE|nr:hypothetical protein [Alteromonas lipolytica]OFI34398.1 hypothetical protein BFC17_18650 [Alteromonas lipolytica]GGF81811.1 hypothetical protein GCM10011338_37560 [Alteromonas lipolytica]
MSSDLLFSVLPREGKVPIVTDDRVKRVSKESRAKQLSEDEKETHDEERLISEQQQYKVHEKNAQDKERSEHEQKEQQAESRTENNVEETESEDELVYNSHGEKAEHHHEDDAPHIDTYE